MSKVSDRARPSIHSRIGLSVPGAIGTLLFAGAVVFGSGLVDAIGPLQGNGDQQDEAAQTDTDKPQDGQDGQDGDAGHETKPADGTPDGELEGKDEPDHDQPDKTPVPEPTPKPTPKPEDKPASEPKPPADGPLTLEAYAFDGKVKLAWSAFGGDGFGGYKVVRSSDSAVAWPLGSGDALAASTEETWHKDFPACDKAWYYRVFAVTDGAHAVLAASNTVKAVVECVTKPTPPPPTAMDFWAEVVEGQVHLGWEACGDEHFGAYKIVRSQTNTNPKYPLNDGTELIGAIGDPNQTSFVDGAVSSGQTWHYRVLSMANDGYGWYALGLTGVLTVTIP